MEGVMSTETDRAEAATDAEAGSTTGADATSGRSPLIIAGSVLAVVAVAAAVVFGVLWHSAASGDSAGVAKMRDEALQAAEQGSLNLTTLDYRNVQQGLDRWKASTTGSLYTQLTSKSLVD